MSKRFVVKTELFHFLFLFEDAPPYVALIDMDSYYRIQPEVSRVGESVYLLETASFMDVNLKSRLQVEFQGQEIVCRGEIADYGVLDGIGKIYEGLTPYEEMMKEAGGKKKEIPSRSKEEIRAAVEGLLSQMTLEEKIGQMSQSAGEDVSEIGGEVESKPMLEQIEAGEIGSVIYIGYSPETIFAYQKLAVEKSRLGIPLLVCQDVVHGFQTIFPIPLAQSSSFDMELIEKCASAAAKEASASGIMCAFAPMLDLLRDPRWGRVCEGTGEDPYLSSRIAKAWVKGYQGTDLGSRETVAACLKHFIGYSACEGGRDYNTVEISDHTLYNMYLPAFQSGIDAGAAMVMSSFNVMNGIPVAANKAILNDLLREKLGFEGVLITDYAAVKEIGIHGLCDSNEEITRKACEATVDLEMATSFYNLFLKKMVEEHVVSENIINDAVRRILTLKYQMGIMDDPYRYIRPDQAKELIYSEEHLKLAREMAGESIILLKNNGILPLDKKKKIALIGPCADSKDMLGAWQFSDYTEQAVTLREGLEKAGYELIYVKGCEIDAPLEHGMEQAVSAAENADVILLAIGESSSMSGEAASRQNITVPESQMALAEALKKTGKPIVTTLTNGRPLLLDWFEEQADAILETWFLGAMAGEAIADIISGSLSPSGKVTMAFPAHPGQIPVYYNFYNTGRPFENDNNRFTSRYLDGPNEPLYPFGYGLTYSKFELSELELDKKAFSRGEEIQSKIRIQNVGHAEATEVVQLYIRDIHASMVRPVKELKGFQRITLKPGEEKEVCFAVTEEMLKFYNARKDYAAEKGEFQIWAGTSSKKQDLKGNHFIYLG